jgi:putative spermidine/putrescine transport system permease protein
MESRLVRVLVKAGSGITLAFLYVPLIVLALYAFSKGVTRSWPPDLWTLDWFRSAWHDPDLPGALARSVEAAVGATLVALILGSLAAFAVHRFEFFGRDAISFALVLPIALPGIVTGIALFSAINYATATVGLHPGLFTIIVGHSTFCVVVVFNNVVARLRRTPTSLVEASMDLGADGIQTFRHITYPALRTALVAGALLAFGLSFDEIVVTNFTAGTTLTLPIWIFNNIRLPKQQPVVNAVALVLMVLSIVPVYFAQRLAGGGGEGMRTIGPEGVEDVVAPAFAGAGQGPG